MRWESVIGGRFELGRQAGSGAMGTIFCATDRRTGSPVALKVLKSGVDDDGRFAREAELVASIRHPAIVKHIDHGRTERGALYLAMEWLDGETLAERLERQGLTLREALTLGGRVASALDVVHKLGVVHRDIKPSNLFLPSKKIEEVKLLDFGIARPIAGDKRLTATGAAVGTPGYMAPEQAWGRSDVDGRADLFSLGAVLFKCLTGRGPFDGNDLLAIMLKIMMNDAPRLREVDALVPAAVDDLVASLLSKEREDRPADAGIVAARISGILAALGDAEDASGAEGPMSQAPTFFVPREITASERRALCLVVVKQPAIPGDVDRAGFVRALHETVEQHQGQMYQVADGSLAVVLSTLGTPRDVAIQAARCALAMKGLLGEVPIAIVSVRAARTHHTLLGDGIERAVRLVGATPAVRLDDVTAGLLDSHFDVGTDAGTRVLRAERDAPAVARTLLGKPTPCVGRERDLGRLEAVLDEVISEPCARAILVTAPAGVGKSRLGYELVERARGRGVEAWIAHGDPTGAGSSFGMLGKALRRTVGIVDGEPLPARLRKLRSRVARHAGALQVDRVTAFLGELIGCSTEGTSELAAARRDTGVMRDQTRRAFEAFLAAECAAKPVLIVLDDLHWGDVSTVRFIDVALRDLRDAPLMVLALARPEVHGRFPRLWAERNAEEVRLRELGKRASEQLVRHVLADAPEDTVVRRIVEQAEGNAFYLEELIRTVAAGKIGALPETVLAMVEARLGTFDPEARRVMRAASVFGQTFWRGGVQMLLGTGAATAVVEEWLAVLTEGEAIARREPARFVGEAEYVFRHPLVREAAYAMLTEADRTLGHAMAARYLEQVGEGDAVVVAEHYERGASPARAVAWFLAAARRAAEVDDIEGAIARAERGVQCGATGEELAALRLIQGEAHVWSSDFQRANELLAETIAWSKPGSPHWCLAMGGAVFIAVTTKNVEQLMPLLGPIAEADPDAASAGILSQSLSIVTTAMLFTGLLDAAMAFVERMEVAIGPWADRDDMAAAWLHRTRGLRAYYFDANPEAAIHWHEQAIQAFDRAGDRGGGAVIQMEMTRFLHDVGEHAQAEALARQALAVSRALSLAFQVHYGVCVLAFHLWSLGRTEEALAEAEQVPEQGAPPMAKGSGRTVAGLVALGRGDLTRAEEELAGALLDGTFWPAVAYAALAETHLLRGDVAAALLVSEQGMDLLAFLARLTTHEPLLALSRAKALRAAGDEEGARAMERRSEKALRSIADRIEDPKLRRQYLANAITDLRAPAAPDVQER